MGGVRLGVASTFWFTTFWRTALTRYFPVRLQCWVSQLLPLLEVAVVPGEEAILLQKREQRVQVEHGAVGKRVRLGCIFDGDGTSRTCLSLFLAIPIFMGFICMSALLCSASFPSYGHDSKRVPSHTNSSVKTCLPLKVSHVRQRYSRVDWRLSSCMWIVANKRVTKSQDQR